MKKDEVKDEKKGYQPKDYYLTDEQTIKLYQALVQIFEDRTNTKVTCTIELSTQLWIKKWTSIERGDEKMKRETILTILLMILCIVAIIGFMILGSYRNQQIQNGELELVYQYGGDL